MGRPFGMAVDRPERELPVHPGSDRATFRRHPTPIFGLPSIGRALDPVRRNNPRPYADLGIDRLEDVVVDVSGPNTVNDRIRAELRHRSTQRALRLRGRLERMYGGPHDPPAISATTPPPAPASRPSARAAARPRRPLSSPPRSAEPNDPQNVLRAWTVLEVLSPASYVLPADLAAGDGRRIARFDRGLPWADGNAKSPRDTRLFFQIVLGSLNLQPAMEQLLRRFADDRPERPSARGETPLAVVIVDREGRPIPDGCAIVSSFAWGIPIALTGDPAMLGEWQTAGEDVQDELHSRLSRQDLDPTFGSPCFHPIGM